MHIRKWVRTRSTTSCRWMWVTTLWETREVREGLWYSGRFGRYGDFMWFCLVVWNIFLFFFHLLGIPSSQLMIFFRGVCWNHQPVVIEWELMWVEWFSVHFMLIFPLMIVEFSIVHLWMNIYVEQVGLYPPLAIVISAINHSEIGVMWTPTECDSELGHHLVGFFWFSGGVVWIQRCWESLVSTNHHWSWLIPKWVSHC